ncbi:hypothetical protein [Micromonospora sp. NBC_00421]|uniref:hypothetical protein n=1 Tax=Micromonospora sp. NBC_00421 TaxID=2975976 RepID=UPI002E1C72F5
MTTNTAHPMTAEQATDIYLTLAGQAGAPLDQLDHFVNHQTSGDFEPYPFTGQLGGGSQFTEFDDRWQVSALRAELDRNPNMRDTLHVTNAALATLRAAYRAAGVLTAQAA